ncbi:hypothetical protein CVT24_012167 [Panaeolus cyanescens]|uniref:glutathione transferase n=1 Tax=Panaeolus cyanescens TaxID=181874 RepID=A0A409YIV2_9AGAR|nr:hypothetical protein CVT24_012167 [Panaeolus cyanescens]
MAIKLYGSLTSCVTMVMCVLKEKGLEYERINIDFSTGEHKSPEYMEKQPFGQVPCLDDDGFLVYECRAICHYLAAKYANQGTPNLIPPADDFKAIARFHQAVSVETHNFNKYVWMVTRERVIKPLYFKQEWNQDIIDQAFKEIDDKLAVYDKILAKQKYMAGDTFTLADLFHLSFGTTVIRCGCKSFEKYPNVSRWWNDISSRKAWQEVYEESKHYYDPIF